MKIAVRLCALIAAIVASGVAYAADLRPILKAPPLAASVYNWSGFYVGAHAGGSWGDNKFSDRIGGIDVAEFTAHGYLLGAQLGYNWQMGPWVLGAELEGSYSHLRRGVGFGGFGGPGGCGQFGGGFGQFGGGFGGCGGGFGQFGGGFGQFGGGFGGCGGFGGFGQFGGGFGGGGCGGQFGTHVEALGLFSGRLGYAWDRTLLYVKGGAAVASEKYVFQLAGVGLSLTPADTRFGWLVGGGLEYGLTANWSIKVEYNYIDLGTKELRPVSPGGVTFVFDQSQKIQLVKAGVNYRF